MSVPQYDFKQHQLYKTPEPPFLTGRVDQYQERVARNGSHILKGRRPGDDAVLLVSNDYLALAGHPTIIDAQVEALRTYGHGLLRSDVYRAGAGPLRQFELNLAQLMEAEDTVLCQSGWCANVGLIQSIADANTPVYLDMHAHASLWEGARSAGATPRPFRHNSAQSLERLIQRHGPGVVAVETVYSTSGSMCPLDEIVELAERYGCIMVVDESHSLGLFGEQGEGLTASWGLAGRVHFRTSSLSKAFAARGGIVAGRARNIEFFRYESKTAVFSSSILPHEAVGFQATLVVIAAENWRREQLHHNADILRNALNALDYNVDASQSQIISLVAGPESRTIILRDALESRGVFGSVFCWPATATSRSLVRFSVNCALSEEQLDRIVSVCAEIRDEIGLYNWSSTQRRVLHPLDNGAADQQLNIDGMGGRFQLPDDLVDP